MDLSSEEAYLSPEVALASADAIDDEFKTSFEMGDIDNVDEPTVINETTPNAGNENTVLTKMKDLFKSFSQEEEEEEAVQPVKLEKAKVVKVIKENYGINIEKIKKWAQIQNSRFLNEEKFQHEIALTKVKGFMNAIIKATRIQAWYRMIKVRKQYLSRYNGKLMLKNKFFIAWRQYSRCSVLFYEQVVGKPFRAWHGEVTDGKRLQVLVKEFFQLCIQRLKLTPQAVFAYFSPSQWGNVLSETDQNKIRRLILIKLFHGWQVEARRLRVRRFKGSQILSRMMRRTKGPLWIKEINLVCFHMWRRYTCIKLAFKREEPEPRFNNPFLPQWAKLLSEMTIKRIKKKRAQERSQVLTTKRIFKRWCYVMTLDRSKSLTPQAIAENFHKKNVYTKIFGGWVSLIRERGQIVRVRDRCFLKWKRFAPLRSRMTLMKKKIKIWDDLTRTKKAFSAMCNLCFDIIGTHATTLKELRKRIFNRKVLTCAYALMNRDVNVLMLDCWRRLKKWWHSRVQWRQSMWNFRYSWYYNRNLTIFKAWKCYVDMKKGRITDETTSLAEPEESTEVLPFKTSYNQLINPEIMTEYLGHVDPSRESSTAVTNDVKLYQMRKSRIPQVAVLHFIYSSISQLFSSGGVVTNELLQSNLQRNIDNFDYDGVASCIADGAIVFPSHVRQISQTVGEQHVSMLALLLQASPIYVADTIYKQALVKDLLNCCDPLKAILLQEHVNRWSNGNLSRREVLTLEQFTPQLYSHLYGRFSSIYFMRILVLLLVKKNLLDTVSTCQTLKISRTIDEEVIEAKKRQRVERLTVLCNSLNLLLFDEVESKNGSYIASISSVAVPPLTWGADGEIRCKRKIDTWVEGLNIYTLLHAYKDMTGKFSAEAFALRQPLIERDDALISNGFIRQARAEFLELRRACMTDAEKLKEKEDMIKQLKEMKKKGKGKGKKKAKGKGKKKGKKSTKVEVEVEVEVEIDDVGVEAKGSVDADDDEAPNNAAQTLDASQEEDVVDADNAKDVLRDLGFGHSFSDDNDDINSDIIDDIDDDYDEKGDAYERKDSFVNDDWEQYGIPGVTGESYEFEDRMQSDIDVKDEIFFQYRLNISLASQVAVKETNFNDNFAPDNYSFPTVALLETYVPIIHRVVVSPILNKNSTNEHRLKSYLLHESKKVKYRILKQFFTWCGILPLDNSSNKLPPQAKVDSVGGFGSWLILNGLRSKTMMKLYSEGSLLPLFWWNKSKVIDKVSLELAAINTMVNAIDERINTYDKEEDDIESHNEYLTGYYYSKKNEVIMIAKKKSTKVVEESNYRQSKANSHKNIEYEILSVEKSISNYKDVIKKCDFLLASNNTGGIVDILQNIELASRDNERFQLLEADSSEGEQELRNNIYSFMEKINVFEIPYLKSRIESLRASITHHANELKLYDKTCLRSTQWLQNLASERFNDMIDVNKIIVAGKDRIDVLNGLRENDMQARKQLVQYNEHLVHFVNELNKLEHRKSLIMNYDTKVNDAVKVDEIETFLEEQDELIRTRRSKFGKLDGINYDNNSAEYSKSITSRSGLLADDDYSAPHLSADISLTDSLQPMNIAATIDISHLPDVKPPDLVVSEEAIGSVEEKVTSLSSSQSQASFKSSPMRVSRAEQELLNEQMKKKEEEAEYEKAMTEMKERTTNEYWLSIAPPKLTKVGKAKDNDKSVEFDSTNESNHSLDGSNGLQVTGKSATTLYWDNAGKTVRKLNYRMKRRTLNNTAPLKSAVKIDEFSDTGADQETDSMSQVDLLEEATQIIRPIHFDEINSAAWQSDLSCPAPSVSIKEADVKNNTTKGMSTKAIRQQAKAAAADTFLSVGKYYQGRIKHALSNVHEWDDDNSSLIPESVNKMEEEEVKDSDSVVSAITVDNAIKTDIDIDSYLHDEEDDRINFIEALGTSLLPASSNQERSPSPVPVPENDRDKFVPPVLKKGVSFQDKLEFNESLDIPLQPPPPVISADIGMNLDNNSICDSLNSLDAKDNVDPTVSNAGIEYSDDIEFLDPVEVQDAVKAAIDNELVAISSKIDYVEATHLSIIEHALFPIPEDTNVTMLSPSDAPLATESLDVSDNDSASMNSTELSVPGINISVSEKKKRKQKRKTPQHQPVDISSTLVVSPVSSPKSSNANKVGFTFDQNSPATKAASPLQSQLRDIKIKSSKNSTDTSKLGDFVTDELSKFNEERLKLIEEFVRAQKDGDDVVDELELDDEDPTPQIRLNQVTMTNITDSLLQRLDDTRDRPGPSDKMVKSDKASVQKALRSVKNRKLLVKELEKIDRKNLGDVTSPKRNLQLLIHGSGNGVDVPAEGLVKKKLVRKLDKGNVVTKDSNIQRLEGTKLEQAQNARRILINGRGFVPPLLDDYVASMASSTAGATANISNHYKEMLPNLSISGSQVTTTSDDHDIDSINKSSLSINKLAEIIMDDEDDEDLQQVYMAIFGSDNTEVKSLQQTVEFDDEIDDMDNGSYPTALFDGISEASNLRNNHVKDADIIPSTPTTHEVQKTRLHLASRDASTNNTISFRDYVTSRGGPSDANGPTRSSTAAPIDEGENDADAVDRVTTPMIIQSAFSPLRSKLLSAERPNAGSLPLSRGVSQPSFMKTSADFNDVWYNIHDETDADVELELRSMLSTTRSLKSRNSSSPKRGSNAEKKPPKILLPAMTNTTALKLDASSTVNFDAFPLPGGGLKLRKKKGGSNRNTLKPLFTYDVDGHHSVDDLHRNFNVKGIRKSKPKLFKNLLSYSTSALPTGDSLPVTSNGADNDIKQNIVQIAPPKVSIVKTKQF